MSKKLNEFEKLLIRPRPFDGESLAGYQLRVAEANGYPNGIWLSGYFLGTRKKFIHTSDYEAKSYRVLGLTSDELGRLAYVRDEVNHLGSVHYFGHKLHPKHIKTKFPAVCPLCLKERVATNGFWDLKYAVACPFHGIKLIDFCQQCGAIIIWERSKICSCHKCKFDYRDSLTERATVEVLELIKLLYSTANISLLTDPENESDHGMPIWALKSESLSTLIWMFSFISRHLCMDPKNPVYQLQNDHLSRLGKEYQSVLKTAYFLCEWPDRLFDGMCIEISNNASKASYLIADTLLRDITRTKMPLLFRQIGTAFIESANILNIKRTKVDSLTLEHARLKVALAVN